MTDPQVIRIDDARSRARELEDAIARARQLYPDANPEAMAAYLDSLVEDLAAIRARIDNALGLGELRVPRASLWIRLLGTRVGEGRAPANLLGRLLASLQTAVGQVAAYIETGDPVIGRIPFDIATESSLDVLALMPGSAKIAFGPAYPQERVDHPAPLADEALRRVVQTVLWAEGGDDDEQLAEILPDARLRRQIVTRIKELTPTETTGYEVIEFSGPVVPERIQRRTLRITPRAHNHAAGYLRRRTTEQVTYQGQLVAIDIERDVFDLRYETRRIHCRFGEDLLQRAKELIEAYVKVRGMGYFQEDSETPFRIDAVSLRRLTAEEQARL
jgi:hypothetical protein